MKVREKLHAHYEEEGLGVPDGWFAVVIRRRRFRLFPLGPLQTLLTLHDLHHMLSGYESSVAGEAEVIAWELGSGGYGRFWYAWFDAFKILVLALLFPRRFRAAFKRGKQFKNLYNEDPESLMNLEWSALVSRVGTP